MKKENDFINVGGTATLNGLSYAEEAKIVDIYLKKNSDICNVCLTTNDGRFLELKNGRFVLTDKSTFINPYYRENKENAFLSSIDSIQEGSNVSNGNNQNKIDRLYFLLYQINSSINTFLSTVNEDKNDESKQ